MLNLALPVRPGERRNALGAFLTLFGLMVAHALLETARDALFLMHLPPTRLPWVYLAIAVAALGLTRLGNPARRWGAGRFRLSITLGAAAVVTSGFWFLLAPDRTWVLYGLYIWSGLIASLILVEFWTVLGGVFTVTQAKRLYAVIGTGSVLGAIAGSAVAQQLTSAMATDRMLPAAAGVFLLTALVPILLEPEPARERTESAATRAPFDIFEPLRLVWSSVYTRRLAILVLVSSMTFTLVDYLFKSALARIATPGQLGYLFATAYLIMNVLSLVAQLALVGILTRSLGVSRVLAILPALLLANSLWLVLGGGILAALALKAADGALRHSLHRTAIEVLFVPLSADVRQRAKAVIDVVGQRGGQALASIGILLAVALPHSEMVLGVGVALFGLVWIVVAKALTKPYLDLFRSALSAGSVRTRIGLPSLDLASLEALVGALSSENDVEVLAALDLLAEQGRTRVIPVLVLYHPSPRVVSRALELFAAAGREDTLPMARRLLSHPVAELRAAALRFVTATTLDEETLRAALDDPSTIVHVTARVGMVAAATRGAVGPAVPADPSILRSLHEIARGGRREEKIALARAIHERPSEAFEEILLALAETADPEVRRWTVRAIGRGGGTAFLPRLLPLLAEREVRDEARDTLVAIGPGLLPFLGEALGDETVSVAVRRQIPRTLVLIDPERGADLLVRRLADESHPAVRTRILRALGNLAADQPDVALPRGPLAQARDQTLREIFKRIDQRSRLERGAVEEPARATAVHHLLVTLLTHMEASATERLFRLIGLLHPAEDVRHVYRGIRSGDRRARSSGRELIESLLAPPLRDAVIAVVDEVPDEQRLARSGAFHSPRRADYEETLRELLEDDSTAVRCMVADHVAELGLSALRPDLESIALGANHSLASAITRALAFLAGPSPAESPNAG